MGEVLEFDQKIAEPVRKQERVDELMGHIANLALIMPAIAIEASSAAIKVGPRVIKRVMQPKTPDIPWFTPYDTVEDLRSKGMDDKQIGRHERFKRKSRAALRDVSKIGD